MVRQYTNYWCVPATTQSMINLVNGKSDRSYATQRRLYREIRAHNRYRYATRGNDPQGWAWGLRRYTSMDYQARSFTNKSKAVWAIYESLARTKHPVGVPMFRGTHAWIVLGYKVAVDPTEPSKRTLLGFYVSGPLGTKADRWPIAWMPLATFRTKFTRYHEWQRTVIWEGKWVVISH